MNVCHTGGSKHWLFCSCHYRRVLLIHLAANDDCSALPPLFCCQNRGRGWPHNSFVGCATKGSGSWFHWPRFPGKGRLKATQVNGWRSESLLGRWWIYHPAAVGRLVLLKAWNFRGRLSEKVGSTWGRWMIIEVCCSISFHSLPESLPIISVRCC